MTAADRHVTRRLVRKPAMPRRYTMRVRADDVAARRNAIVDAARSLFFSRAFDDVTLQDVAERAGVALKTVVRAFGTKEKLLLACAGRGAESSELHHRAIEPGDIAGACRVLADRYELGASAMRRHLDLELRIGAIGKAIQRARLAHHAWLADVFTPWLPPRGDERARRLAALFALTEIFVWWEWRHTLGLSRADAELALRSSLEALTTTWTHGGSKGHL